MRRAAKTDGNARMLDEAFERLGCSVAKLDHAGGGFPDRAVGYAGQCCLVEYKMPGKARYTEAQERFRRFWTGGIRLVQTVEDVQGTVVMLRSWHAAIVAASHKL